MNKAQKRAGTVLVLLLAVIILVGNLPSLKSIFIGGAVSYRYIYVNTYDYPSMAQQPAVVKWSFSPNGASASSGTCTTSLELFNSSLIMSELDAPVSTSSGTSTGIYPLSQAYVSTSMRNVNVNLALCLIQIPLQSLSTPPNTTIGTLFLQATGTNGYSSGIYSASLSVNASLYENWIPILITLPLTNQTITSTTTTTSTTTSSSTTSSTTTINSTTAVLQPPVNQNSGFFSNIISSIQNAIRSFINSIINALKW